MSKKSKTEVKVDDRLTQLRIEKDEITMMTKDHQSKLDKIESQILLLEELLIK
jgi:hypothetical protein